MKQGGYRRFFGWVLTVTGFIASFIIASLFAELLVIAANTTGAGWSISSTVGALGFRLVTYGVMILLLIMVPYWVFRRRRVSRAEMGAARLPTLRDIVLALAGVVVYVAATLLAQFLLQKVPGFDTTQVQNLGVSTKLIGGDLIAAYIVFVVATPFAEELMFRGILYGRLRSQKMGPWLTAIIVSVLFGIAHMQWNVGIDVFCMSMVACYLRELTGTIWPGVVLHMLKNALAFWFVFVISQPIAG